MSEWQPIDTFDALPQKDRPKHAVFLFAATPPSRGMGGWCNLSPTVETQRHYGSRTCTHWHRIEPPPEDPLEAAAKLARKREREERRK